VTSPAPDIIITLIAVCCARLRRNHSDANACNRGISDIDIVWERLPVWLKIAVVSHLKIPDLLSVIADPRVRAVYGVGLRPLAWWYCWIESRRAHGRLSLVSVVCCQKSLYREDHSSRGFLPSVVCLSVIVKPRWWRGQGPPGVVTPWEKNISFLFVYFIFLFPVVLQPKLGLGPFFEVSRSHKHTHTHTHTH